MVEKARPVDRHLLIFVSKKMQRKQLIISDLNLLYFQASRPPLWS
jgi:hypothetical protein